MVLLCRLDRDGKCECSILLIYTSCSATVLPVPLFGCNGNRNYCFIYLLSFVFILLFGCHGKSEKHSGQTDSDRERETQTDLDFIGVCICFVDLRGIAGLLVQLIPVPLFFEH